MTPETHHATTVDDAPVVHSMPHALYKLADIDAALGVGLVSGDIGDMEAFESGGLASSRTYLRRLQALGDEGRWRRLALATPRAIAAVEALGSRAPHLNELTEFIVRRLRASVAT
ncbi:MAG: hypothetical protein ACRYGP_08180, partial [Janthinobacterium lividum]